MKASLKLAFLVLLLAICLPNRVISHCQSRGEELRDKLATAFEAVAEAESKGGDVSNLVDELNQALGLLEAGGDRNMAEARLVIEGVLSEVPAIEQQGVSSTGFGYVKAGIIICMLAAISILVWRFGPRVFWSIWLRSKRDWVIRT